MTIAHQNLTDGCFPVASGCGNQCTPVGYHCDADHIIGAPVKNQTASALTES